MILWECTGTGYNGSSGLLQVAAQQPVLGPYLSAGGKLWLGGRINVAATTLNANGVSSDLSYPKDLTLATGNFARNFLKLESTKIENDKGETPRHTFVRAIPMNETDPIYEAMNIDPGKLNPVQAQSRGASHVDAVFDPIFAEQQEGFRGDIDSLFAYGAWGDIMQGIHSTYHDRLVAVRWHDPDPDRDHGRTQWFGFPMYFLLDNEAQETFNRSMDWFLEETPGTPGP
jgi:hypothetical protein